MLNDLKKTLSLYWLRPECVPWITQATQILKPHLKNAEDLMELGIGNGIFTFLTLGGELSPKYDWYYNVNTQGFSQNKDIYDCVSEFNIKDFIVKQPTKNLKLAIDHKQNLLDQTAQLGFVDQIICADANKQIKFNGVKNIFSNILYWLDNPAKVIEELSGQMPTGGKVFLVFPNSKFYEYCQSYQQSTPLQTIYNRGRADSMKWRLDVEDVEKKLIINSDFKLIHCQNYLCRNTLKTWDYGLRPFSPHLIKMANMLTPDDRFAIKNEWCQDLLPLLIESMEIELDKGEEEGGYHFIILEKK